MMSRCSLLLKGEIALSWRTRQGSFMDGVLKRLLNVLGFGIGLVMMAFCSSCCHVNSGEEGASPTLIGQLEDLTKKGSRLEQADFVVLASPIASRKTKMTVTLETTVFTNSPTEVVCDCWETDFLVYSVLKGDANTSRLTLIHYVPQSYKPFEILNLTLAKFKFSEITGEGPIVKEIPVIYLLYLKAYSPGKFVPVTGQKNSAFSVEELSSKWHTLSVKSRESDED